MEGERVLHVAAADLLTSLYSGKPSACFCLDLRHEQALQSGTIPSELNVEASAWKKELLLEGVMNCLAPMKGNVTPRMRAHIENHHGDDERSSRYCCGRRRSRINLCEVRLFCRLYDRVLRTAGFPRVCVVDGGFFAVHEYIRRLNKLEWLVDHDKETCEGK